MKIRGAAGGSTPSSARAPGSCVRSRRSSPAWHRRQEVGFGRWVRHFGDARPQRPYAQRGQRSGPPAASSPPSLWGPSRTSVAAQPAVAVDDASVSPVSVRQEIRRTRAPGWRSVFCPLDRGLDDTVGLSTASTSTRWRTGAMPIDPTDRLPLGPPTRLVTAWVRRSVDRRSVLGRHRRGRVATVSVPGTSASARSTSRPCTAMARPSDAWERPSRPAADAYVVSTKVGRLVRDGRRDPARRGCRPPGPRRSRGRVLRPRPAGSAGVRLQRGRRPPLARGEPGAPRPRPDRHRPDPRPRRPLGSGHRGGVAGARSGCAPRASSARSGPA